VTCDAQPHGAHRAARLSAPPRIDLVGRRSGARAADARCTAGFAHRGFPQRASPASVS